MFDYKKILNADANSEDVKNFIKTLGLTEVQKAPSNGRYQGSRKRGLDLLIRNEKVTCIQIYVEATQGYSAYSGDLPFNIQRGMSQDQVHALLGKPEVAGKTLSRFPLPSMKGRLAVIFNSHSIVEGINIEGPRG